MGWWDGWTVRRTGACFSGLKKETSEAKKEGKKKEKTEKDGRRKKNKKSALGSRSASIDPWQLGRRAAAAGAPECEQKCPKFAVVHNQRHLKLCRGPAQSRSLPAVARACHPTHPRAPRPNSSAVVRSPGVQHAMPVATPE